VRPSQTSSGRSWLGNFSGPDVPTATLLLDSLWFVSLSTMHNSLKARLEQLARGGEMRTPALVLPERALGAPELGVPRERREAAVAFQDFQPGAPISITPGSDGFVGGILRDFTRAGRRAPASPWIPTDATLEQLRDRRCRSIMLVTDYIGSGDRILTLAAAIARHPTIRSWRSLRLLDIRVLAFAANPEALPRLETSKPIDGVSFIEAAPTFATAPWTSVVREAILELCHRACRTRAHWALGYKGSCGLFATQRGAPNNLPAIFWQTTAGWWPLFPNRTVPSGFARELAEYRQSEPLAELAERIGQLRLGRNQRLDHMRATSRALLQVLILINRQARSSAMLAAELGTDISNLEALLRSLQELGLVDATGSITAAGRREILAQKRGLRRTTAGLEGADDPYYPVSLK
jgi:hypothetical protein